MKKQNLLMAQKHAKIITLSMIVNLIADDNVLLSKVIKLCDKYIKEKNK